MTPQERANRKAERRGVRKLAKELSERAWKMYLDHFGEWFFSAGYQGPDPFLLVAIDYHFPTTEGGEITWSPVRWVGSREQILRTMVEKVPTPICSNVTPWEVSLSLGDLEKCPPKGGSFILVFVTEYGFRMGYYPIPTVEELSFTASTPVSPDKN